MNRFLTYLSIILILSSCSPDDMQQGAAMSKAVELTGIEASLPGGVSTRAAALDPDYYVGRSNFVNNDRMVLTTIKRTAQTIPGFHYSGIVYDHVIEEEQTSGGWNRDLNEGYAHDKNGELLTTHPERIYWSDSHNGHTYIGYSVPQQPVGGTPFDWTKETSYGGSGTAGIPVYYGSLGNPRETTGFIDYADNDKIKCDDILLTWDNEKLAETGGSVAKLYFHHGLAQVRVVVNIQGFSASSSAVDSRSVVSGMILKDMLTMYRWRQESYEAEALDVTLDADNISKIYGSESGVTCDQKKDVHLWIPRPDGTGSGTGKLFTFYGLAVPTTMDAASLNLQFTVTYQDPMDPWKDPQKKTEPNMKDHTYTAQMPSDIVFRAGYCTTINITLNHNNERMTVGAEYMDWQLVETPDQGELQKNVTFMNTTQRNTVTILGDPLANEDDATWLYVDAKDNNRIKDIYGNDGSQASPFKISTASQLLSFAYEVKGTQRKAITYTSPEGESRSIAADAGFDFSGYWVTLDADITMQKSLEGTDITWPGIGENDDAHRFNGIFNGGYRHINRLKDSPLFTRIGEDAVVDHLFINDALGIAGTGSIAEVNYGVICGAYIECNVVATKENASSGNFCGSIVGENHSMLISCGHIGDIEGTGYEAVGALVGYNDGIVAICYNCGDVEGNGMPEYAGIGEYSPRSIAYCCYFNGDLYKGQDYENLDKRIGHVAFPLTTAMMQSNVFVNKFAPYEGLTKEHEIIDDGLPLQTDPFFFHLSLNYGIRRAVAMLKRAVEQTADAQGYIPIHAASGEQGELNHFEELRLKKTLVQWLIDHYSSETTPGGELEFSHQFQFVPATYPKLY